MSEHLFHFPAKSDRIRGDKTVFHLISAKHTTISKRAIDGRFVTYEIVVLVFSCPLFLPSTSSPIRIGQIFRCCSLSFPCICSLEKVFSNRPTLKVAVTHTKFGSAHRNYSCWTPPAPFWFCFFSRFTAISSRAHNVVEQRKEAQKKKKEQSRIKATVG